MENLDNNFHLYLLIGQSNMAGRGALAAEDQQTHPRVFSLDKAGNWVPAADPIHFDKPGAAVGPGLTFGKTMAGLYPTARIGLIPCAVGGSHIMVWKEGVFWDVMNCAPYDDATRRTRLAMAQGVPGTPGTLKGILWHQGESDSKPGEAELYADRLGDLVETLRADLGTPQLPFVAATLGDFVEDINPQARTVNTALRQLPQRVKYTACVESTGLGNKDQLHFNAEAARELGRRYAQVMRAMI